MTEEVLSFRNVVKFFEGKEVLHGISFALRRGERIGLLGESGSGKSTIAGLAAGLTVPEQGSVFRNAPLQMVFQMPIGSFDPRKTLGWSIAEALFVKGVSQEQCREAALTAVSEVGLNGDMLERYPHEVSGGECQRAAIARALVGTPEILICDEVTSALDMTIQREIMELLTMLCERKKIACLFITHEIALLPFFCHRVLVLEEGRLVEDECMETFFQQPKSKAAIRLLEACKTDWSKIPL